MVIFRIEKSNSTENAKQKVSEPFTLNTKCKRKCTYTNIHKYDILIRTENGTETESEKPNIAPVLHVPRCTATANHQTRFSSFCLPLQPLLQPAYPPSWYRSVPRYLGQVVSPTSTFLSFHGAMEVPSSHLPSEWQRPVSSRWLGIFVASRDLLKISVMTVWHDPCWSGS